MNTLAQIKFFIIVFTMIFGSCEKLTTDRESDVKTIALTFDDGPDSKYTPLILDILKKNDVKATFFLVGDNTKKYPKIAKRIFLEGHCVGNHTTNHMRLLGKSFNYIYPNIISTQNLIDSIKNTCGINSTDLKLFRPPFGLITKEQTDSLKKHGFKIILWNINSKDWSKEYNDDEIFNKVIGESLYDKTNTNGVKIILLHCADYKLKDSRMNTVEVLSRIISALKDAGYSFVKIDEINQ